LYRPTAHFGAANGEVKMKAVVFDEIGAPLDVLRLDEVPVPEIGPDEVLVKIVTASVNPGDFLFIQGLYPEPKIPSFPGQIAGGHAAGLVVEAGANVQLEPGTLVGFSYGQLWAEYAAVPAAWLIPLPADYAPEKAAQLVNAITAWDLVRDAQVEAGQWLALTAGSSAVATMALQMAAMRGVKVISIVRRSNDHLDLTALGAAEVVELSSLQGSVGERVMEITDGAGLNAVVDCVGGQLVGELIRSLALFGRTVCYGGLSTEGFELHNFDILFKAATLTAYSYRYFFDPPPEADHEELREVVEVAGSTDFHVPVGAMHPIEEFETAVRETIERPELGKRFLAIAGAEQ
jgi:NADPH2:quinone reductase